MDQCIEHAEKIAALESSLKSAHHKIDKLEENQKILYEMNTNIRLLAQQNKTQNHEIKNIKENLNEINNKVDNLEDRPLIESIDNYKLIKRLIITAIVSGVIGYIFNQIL